MPQHAAPAGRESGAVVWGALKIEDDRVRGTTFVPVPGFRVGRSGMVVYGM
jgi:hypothetical protein